METMAEQGPNPDLSTKLLRWYDAHARVLPWRVKAPVKADPYRVWLSEIMLQQTTVATVKDYFIKFTNAWPTVQDLASAELDEILRAWAGLGYYARARNLHACAKTVACDLNGIFPSDIDALQKLPGIGRYTAGAIAAIAFDQPHAAVDGNVERVLSRLYAIEQPLPASKPEIKLRAQALVPIKRAGDFAQALMDLGATVCTPKSPACGNCPWADHCEGREKGIAASLPRKAKKKAILTRKGFAYFLIREDGHVLLRRRPEKGLLGGMMEVPGSDWSENPADVPPVKAKWKKRAGLVEHTFTHFHLEVTVLVAKVKSAKLPDDTFIWVKLSKAHEQALPTVMRKIMVHGLK